MSCVGPYPGAAQPFMAVPCEVLDARAVQGLQVHWHHADAMGTIDDNLYAPSAYT